MIDLRDSLRFDAKELALISVFSSLWVVSEVSLGPTISQITQVHGVIERVLGWLLMFMLAELTGKFGRVTMMSAIASLATRIIRLGRLYALFVGIGYALGGFTFDLLLFGSKETSEGKHGKSYLILISFLSGTIALIPYLLFELSVLGSYGFILWIPYYVYAMVKGVILSVLGTTLGILVSPRIKSLRPKIAG